MNKSRIAIIGAGPIGLEAALYADQLGYQVTIFEKDEVAKHLLEWGHVTLFSPWEMNHSRLGPKLLKQQNQKFVEPSPNDYLTGKEHVEAYLRPLSKLPQLAGKILTGTRVEAISREGVLKGDLIGDASRAHHPFRILTTDINGHESVHIADFVIDASGIYGTPNWLGQGGIPALGEKRNRDHIDYKLVDVYGKDRAKFAGRKTLLVGAGYSAATTACDFQNLIREEPGTSLTWVARGDRSLPVPPIEDDPLPNRAQLTHTANALAQPGLPQVKFRNRTSVSAIKFDEATSTFNVELQRGGSVETISVDRIISNTGFGPDNSLYRELQVHECYATRGPMKLAAALLGSASADCLAQTSMGADTLKNPEPNFFIIGNKSYGRNSTFLVRIGFSQIVEIFFLITEDASLNLYEQYSAEVESR